METKKQLLNDVTELHRQIGQVKEAENEHKQLMEETIRSFQTQAVINNLLHIALKNMSLESTLALFIVEITSL